MAGRLKIQSEWRVENMALKRAMLNKARCETGGFAMRERVWTKRSSVCLYSVVGMSTLGLSMVLLERSVHASAQESLSRATPSVSTRMKGIMVLHVYTTQDYRVRVLPHLRGGSFLGSIANMLATCFPRHRYSNQKPNRARRA